MAAEPGLGSIVQKRSLPLVCLGLAGLFLALSFAVPWYSADAILDVYEYDSEASEDDFRGDKITTLRINLDMYMLRMDTEATPRVLDDRIENQGAPSYEDHAGNTGTLMLGVLMLQFSVI